MNIPASRVSFVPITDTIPDIEQYLSIADAVRSPYNRVPESAERVREELRQNHCLFIIFDGQKVGFVEVRRDDPSTEEIAYLAELQVHPDFHHLGIGSKTMEHLKAYCRYSGSKIIKLHTHPHNDEAVRFYYKNGFWEFGKGFIENYKNTGAPRMEMRYRLK